MGFFDIAAILIVLAALFAYFTCRTTSLPTSAGVAASAFLAGGLTWLLLKPLGASLKAQISRVIPRGQVRPFWRISTNRPVPFPHLYGIREAGRFPKGRTPSMERSRR